jgi:hypothetical protein
MTFEEFSAFPPDQQRRIVQGIYPVDEGNPLLAGIKAAFLETFPKCAQAEHVVVGEGANMGGFNAIIIRTKPGGRLRLPREFMGLFIVRTSVGRSGSWLPR